MKPLLRYLMPTGSEMESKIIDSEVSAGGEEKARSQHQRMLAIEIFSSLVKASQKNQELLSVLAKDLDLITSVLLTVVQTSDSWQQKKVKKTMVTLNIFTKLAKNITMSSKIENKSSVERNGALIIKQIEKECEKDKSMSNLKGKIKEIQKLIS